MIYEVHPARSAGPSSSGRICKNWPTVCGSFVSDGGRRRIYGR